MFLPALLNPLSPLCKLFSFENISLSVTQSLTLNFPSVTTEKILPLFIAQSLHNIPLWRNCTLSVCNDLFKFFLLRSMWFYFPSSCIAFGSSPATCPILNEHLSEWAGRDGNSFIQIDICDRHHCKTGLVFLYNSAVDM